jgi:hypothetical protein
MGELKAAISKEFTAPSPEFVKYFTHQVYEHTLWQKVIDEFTPLVKRAINNYINDLISDRLKAAIKDEEKPQENAAEQEEVSEEPVSKIVTTEEELQGYYIIKSILHGTIPVERVTYKDTQSYFSILIDNSIRKLVCRLCLNSPKSKHLLLYDDDKKELNYKISSIDEIYNYSEQIIAAASKYL